jgi:hypothetical protein
MQQHIKNRAGDQCRQVKTQNLWERGLPAKNDDAQYLKNRGAFFAGKPRSHRISSPLNLPALGWGPGWMAL